MTDPRPFSGENEALDEVDHALLARIARVHEAVDPVPADLVDRITFNLTLAGLHAEIARLQRADASLTRTEGLAAHEVESMTFSGSRVSLMITVAPDEDEPGRVRLDGWVTRGGTAVELVTRDEVRTEVADDRGRLAWRGVTRGFVHFVIRPDHPEEPATITPRVEL